MNVIGLDVCKNAVVAWCLDSVPRNLKQHFKDNRRKEPDPFKFYANLNDIQKLLALQPDAIALEPTGIHYAWIWAHIARSEGIAVRWVGHQEVAHFRKQARLPDKNDQADALALAAYTLTYWEQARQFLSFDHAAIVRLRELYLQLQSLTRIQNPVVNRARQQLAREFPEAALMDSKISAIDGVCPLWAWIGEVDRKIQTGNLRYSRLYAESVAPIYGVEISNFTRRLARLHCDLTQWEVELEAELSVQLSQPQFYPYREIMTRLGLGPRQQALLISQIYPISRFESLGGFKRRLGVAKVEDSSGDRQGQQSGHGSKLRQTELYLWILTTYAPKKSRPDNELAHKIAAFYDERKARFDDPELWKQKVQERTQRKALEQIKAVLQTDAIPAVVIQAVLSAVETSIADLAPEAKPESRRGFGNLVISQTAGYGVRLLYRELKRAISPIV
jgi:hypothetical protein